MIFNFELLLTLIVLITGIVWLVDNLFFARARKQQNQKTPMLIDYAKSFFPVLLLVLLLRSFLLEPFRIPSGSDEPTLLVGDLIVANKFEYGLRLPVLHTKIVQGREPQVGDIVLFRWPVDPSMNFIKRVVGAPGDHVSYTNKVLTINGQEATQQPVGMAMDSDEAGQTWAVQVMREMINGVVHEIYVRPDAPPQDFSIVVPPNQYFVMGDNRDNSNDSRYWGLVPEQNILGKAAAIWFSWDSTNDKVRWQRIGTLIN